MIHNSLPELCPGSVSAGPSRYIEHNVTVYRHISEMLTYRTVGPGGH